MRLLALVTLLPLAVLAKEIPVAVPSEFDAAVDSAKPGDVILLPEGEWKDAKLLFKAKGTPEAPITLKAATPGKTILSGVTQLRIGGEHLIVSGLWFKNPDPAAGDTIEFRESSKNVSSNCRLTECAITREPGAESKDSKESRWVGLYGENNRFDHCLIQGKTNKGASLVVWLGNGQKARHQIDHNYFGPREALGKNGGETIRIGDSTTSMETAACVVEHNLFERCNGEAECISNKSCGNLYRENTFQAVSGALTLRHGNACTVERNVFLGDNESGTGGIRIIGEDHVVSGNYLEGLRGDDARSGITLVQGIPDSPLEGYFQVKRARIENNVLVDCEHPILIGLAGKRAATLPPLDCAFVGNIVMAPKAAVVVETRCSADGVRWEGNTFWGKSLGMPDTAGITWQETKPEPLKPIARADAGPSWWK